LSTILVTGGYGFIGSNFINYCLSGPPIYKTIINVDALKTGSDCSNVPKKLRNNPDVRYVAYHQDICDQEIMKYIIESEKPDIIVNFAAESHVDRSIQSCAPFVQSNIVGVQTLLDLCIQHDIRFHQVGTDEVYGSLGPSQSSSKEDDILKPRNPYSATKASADLLTLSYFHTHNAKVTISRGSNTYGPNQWPEKLIPLFVKRLVEGEKVPVYGTGENIREWLYVDDHVRGILAILEHGKYGEVYNIGSSKELTNIEITRKILAHFGYDDSKIEYVEDRKGHDFRYSLNSMKIYRSCKWTPQEVFDISLSSTLEWFRGKFTT